MAANNPFNSNGSDTHRTPMNGEELHHENQAEGAAQLEAIGGDSLEGSGFEDEIPEEDFL